LLGVLFLPRAQSLVIATPRLSSSETAAGCEMLKTTPYKLCGQTHS
jgi:hypothetical protein